MGRFFTDEQPLRIDQPAASFAGTPERPVQEAQYRDDFTRSTRSGQKVYVWQLDPSVVLTPDAWRSLPGRPKAGAGVQGDAPSREAKKQSKFFGGGSVLSPDEVARFSTPDEESGLAPFPAVLMDMGGYADKAIWLDYPAGVDAFDIWGDFTPDEAELLSNGLLKLGTRNVMVAEGIRTAIEWKDYAALLALLAPRIQKTVAVRKNAPQRQKKAKRGGLSLFRKEQAG